MKRNKLEQALDKVTRPREIMDLRACLVCKKQVTGLDVCSTGECTDCYRARMDRIRTERRGQRSTMFLQREANEHIQKRRQHHM